MSFLLHPSTLAILAHGAVMMGIAVRVIMKRPPTGVALAWLLLVAMIPLGGVVAYFMIGERRIGRIRTQRMGALLKGFQPMAQAAIREGLTDVDWSRHPAAARGMDRLGHNVTGSPTVRGSGFEIFSDTAEILSALARDLDAARTSVLMEFYIWSEGGKADEVLEAVIRAAGRGVACRLLVDALGARPWWKGKQPQRLRAAGVDLRAALPVGLLRTFVGRTDLRLHRKIVVIDGEVAWTGSMNLVDPRFFKQDAGVGQWVDAMARIRGAAVAPLAATVLGDWVLETGEPLEPLIKSAQLHLIKSEGSADMQVIPSGPSESGEGLLQMILALINAAQTELVLTTPYLVPDDSLLRALRGAAGRGVKVRLIVPERVDSALARYASRSYYDDQLGSGVEIYLYRDGLLHTKSIVADSMISMFGTANLDMRSLWLNYEVALFVYDAQFSRQLRSLQQIYLSCSDRIDPMKWSNRSFGTCFLENTIRLVSPLL